MKKTILSLVIIAVTSCSTPDVGGGFIEFKGDRRTYNLFSEKSYDLEQARRVVVKNISEAFVANNIDLSDPNDEATRNIVLTIKFTNAGKDAIKQVNFNNGEITYFKALELSGCIEPFYSETFLEARAIING